MLIQTKLGKFTTFYNILREIALTYRADKIHFLQDFTTIYPILENLSKIIIFYVKSSLIHTPVGRFVHQNVQNQILRNFQNECLSPH